jgi:hypothetical protein
MNNLKVPRLLIPAVVAALMVLCAGVGLAHAAGFTIWGIGYDMWTGQINHYNHDPYCGYQCPYDYMLPTNAEVHQSAPGDFVWMYLDMPAGNVFQGGDAYKGDMYLIGGHGELTRSGALHCTSVTVSGGFYLDAVINGGSQGYWEQDNGGGPACYSAYLTTDKQAVTAP